MFVCSTSTLSNIFPSLADELYISFWRSSTALRIVLTDCAKVSETDLDGEPLSKLVLDSWRSLLNSSREFRIGDDLLPAKPARPFNFNSSCDRPSISRTCLGNARTYPRGLLLVTVTLSRDHFDSPHTRTSPKSKLNYYTLGASQTEIIRVSKILL